MEFSVDKDGKRIDAWNVSSSCLDGEFFCPVCSKPVIFRNGDVNVPHFAHRSGECVDSWHYDMSEWHKGMQSCFPAENREVVVSHNGKKHRADILVDNMVVEFQHSPITAAEFDDRNDYFMGLGYHVAWVFDVSDDVASGRICCTDCSDVTFKWKWPKRIFYNAPSLSDYNKDFSLWLYFGNNEEDPNQKEIWKVVWSTKNEHDEQTLSRFILSGRTVSLNENIDAKYLFFSEGDYLREAEEELKNGSVFQRKYAGEKGHIRDAYVCPRRPNEFGIKAWGESGCLYCRYCGLASLKSRQERTDYGSPRRKDQWVFYCCFPKQVREPQEGHPGYECPSVEIFEI